MRGVRFYAIDFNKYTSNNLLCGARYRIEIPIYNASFKDVPGVKVKLYWVKDREEASLAEKVYIGESQSISMTGWRDDGDNKAWARINFTPNITVNGHYQLYAEIDYAGDEVHKKRDVTTDPGGNNEGYFEFAVENLPTVAATSIKNASFKASAEDEIIFPDITFNGIEKWEQFYKEYIAGTEGPVSMEVVITNNMPYTLPDTEVTAVYYDDELLKEHTIGSATFVKKFTLFPHETYKFDVNIDADIADKMRKADFTFCSYTLFWLEYLFDSVYGEGDTDPDLEVFTADIDDNDIYFNSVTKTYELSHDIPVLWRLGEVVEMVNTSETESVDDETTSNITVSASATEEDFTITWNPKDAETTKTDNVEITISTIPGITLKGNYGFTIEISEDGETWEELEVLTFEQNLNLDEETDNDNGLHSSSGGCDAGISALSILLLAVVVIRKY